MFSKKKNSKWTTLNSHLQNRWKDQNLKLQSQFPFKTKMNLKKKLNSLKTWVLIMNKILSRNSSCKLKIKFKTHQESPLCWRITSLSKATSFRKVNNAVSNKVFLKLNLNIKLINHSNSQDSHQIAKCTPTRKNHQHWSQE